MKVDDAVLLYAERYATGATAHAMNQHLQAYVLACYVDDTKRRDAALHNIYALGRNRAQTSESR